MLQVKEKPTATSCSKLVLLVLLHLLFRLLFLLGSSGVCFQDLGLDGEVHHPQVLVPVCAGLLDRVGNNSAVVQLGAVLGDIEKRVCDSEG